MAAASNGPSIGHLVLTVRDIEASHRFYTAILGFEQCGTFKNASFPDVDMRFYRGSPDHHHDLALVQSPDPARTLRRRRSMSSGHASASITSRSSIRTVTRSWPVSNTCRNVVWRPSCVSNTG